MIYLLILLAFTISALMSMIIIPRILVVALKKRLFDIPDSRKVHKEAIPRLGGLSFAPSILFSSHLFPHSIARNICTDSKYRYGYSHILFQNSTCWSAG